VSVRRLRTPARVAGLVLAAGLLAGVLAAWAQPGTTDQAIQQYQARLARRPDDVRTYARLGQAYILKARETGDAQYYDLAEKALRHGLTLAPDPVTARRTLTELAVVQMARHEFRDALATARQALAVPSDEVNPYGLAGDAHLELGEYAEAEAAYEKMRGARGAQYPHSRLAFLRFLKGDPAGAITEMARAAEAAAADNQPRENIAWAHARRAYFLFQTGDLARAGTAYEQALVVFPGYHRALAGLAQVRAAQGAYREAVELYRKAIGIIPLLDYAAGLGDVHTRLGQAEEARKQYALVEYIGRLTRLSQVLYNRELALFYLDHDLKLAEALDLARKEWTVRPDLYSHDVLAWALYKNGQAREAVAPMAEALKLGTRDARLFFHAGMIHQATGDPRKAREFLTRALQTNPHFHLLQGEVAKAALKALGG
jgi:tetratricopeptide (TPR) repeat protein